MPSLLSLVLLLVACAGPSAHPDPWVEARTACSRSALDCELVLADHLGLDDAVDLTHPLVASLLAGMGMLLDAEPPPLSELQPGPWLSEEVLDTLEDVAAEAGGDHAGQALYDLVAVEVRRTTFRSTTPGRIMTFNVVLGELRVDPLLADGSGAALFAHALVHEAAHGRSPRHVPCPWWGPDDRSCDEGWDGAYAHQVAAAGLLASSCDDAPSCAAWEGARDEQRRFILAP